MTNIKGLAFFDLDGTLLDKNSQVTPEIATALAKLQANQIVPVIATGRTNIEVGHIAEKTGIQSLITMNGQYVLFEGKEIYSSLIPKDVSKRLANKTKEFGHEIGFYNHQKITVSAHSAMVEKCYGFIHSDLPPINGTYYDDAPLNMLLILGEDQDSHYHEAFPELTFFRNGPYSIDVIAHGGSKGKGVHELVQALDLEGIPTYGFGDGPNDIDLLNACDHKIAMGNAQPELKNIATYITAKNTEGGIIQALEHFNLI